MLKFNSQKGSIFLVLIFVVVIFFSISLVSGAAKFQYSPEPPSKLRSSASPTATPSAAISPTATPIPNPSDGQWSISFSIDTCANGLAHGVITTSGPNNGYVTLEIQTPSGYTVRSSDASAAPTSTLGLDLPASDGYAATPWRLNLYEGGTGTKDNYSGGTLRNSIDGNPTNCT